MTGNEDSAGFSDVGSTPEDVLDALPLCRSDQHNRKPPDSLDLQEPSIFLFFKGENVIGCHFRSSVL